MSNMYNKEKSDQQLHEQTIHKIRITLASCAVKQLENVSTNIVKNAVENNVFKKGPVRLPTSVLRVSTRKTPNGEGSKTWDTYEMRVHRRYINLQAPAATIKKITQITIEPGVDVEVTIAT